MAKITSPFVNILGLKGSFGDLTIKKTNNGYILSQKPHIDKKRLKTAPEFQRTCENNAAFAAAAKTAPFFIRTFSPSFPYRDTSANRAALRLFYKIVKQDAVNSPAQRKVSSGELSLLNGFELNSNAALTQKFCGNYFVSVNRKTNTVCLTIESFNPANISWRRQLQPTAALCSRPQYLTSTGLKPYAMP